MFSEDLGESFWQYLLSIWSYFWTNAPYKFNSISEVMWLTNPQLFASPASHTTWVKNCLTFRVPFLRREEYYRHVPLIKDFVILINVFVNIVSLIWVNSILSYYKPKTIARVTQYIYKPTRSQKVISCSWLQLKPWADTISTKLTQLV